MSNLLHGDPLISGFKATDYLNAFILNSMAIAITTVTTIWFKKNMLDTHFDKCKSDRDKNIVTFIFSFTVALLSFYVMHILFGFGGGMLVSE